MSGEAKRSFLISCKWGIGPASNQRRCGEGFWTNVLCVFLVINDCFFSELVN